MPRLMTRLISGLDVPNCPDELLKVLDLLLQDTFDYGEVRTELDEEGRLIVSFVSAELIPAFVIETRFVKASN